MSRVAIGVATCALVVAEPAAHAASAPPDPPTVELGSAATLAPDGRSVAIQVIASCGSGQTVLEATVTISQPQASGIGSFPLTCVGSLQSFLVTAKSFGAAFEPGEARASAVVLVGRSGRNEEALDNDVVPVQPSVFVDLAPRARLRAGGAAVTVRVAVACPQGARPAESFVNVGQPQAAGQATFFPICDGLTHTLRVRVPTSGQFAVGSANGAVVGAAEFEGDTFITEIVEALEIS
jgi:hypothetical protein